MTGRDTAGQLDVDPALAVEAPPDATLRLLPRLVDDASLLERARRGDAGAFPELYARHVGRARAEARRLLRRDADVDDVVSSAFTSVFLAIQQGGGPTQTFRGYLLVAVGNAARQLTRTRRYRNEIPSEILERHGSVVAVDDDRLSPTLVAAFVALPERWRSVLWDTEIEGRSNAEIGSELGLSPNGVAAPMKKARRLGGGTASRRCGVS